MPTFVERKPPSGLSQIDWTRSLSRNLVGAWLFNETGGLTVNEYVRGHDGTLTLMAPNQDWTHLAGGSALDFSGSDDVVDTGSVATGNPLQLTASTDFTILALISPTNTGNTFQRVVEKATAGSAANGYGFYATGGAAATRQLLVEIDAVTLYASASPAYSTVQAANGFVAGTCGQLIQDLLLQAILSN